MIHVVAAVIRRGYPPEEEYLVTQRSEDQSHPFEWEFPGGKVEPGETLEQALHRELIEELDIVALIGPKLIEVPFTSEKGAHTVHFFLVQHFEGTPRCVVAMDYDWTKAVDLPKKKLMNSNMTVALQVSKLTAAYVAAPAVAHTGDQPSI